MIWSGINEIIQNKKFKDSDIFLDDNGKILTDQKKVANKFNLFYKNVASNLVEKLPKPNTKFQDYLKNPNKNSMFLNETEPGEVFTLLNNLDISKAADIYGISPKLIKLGAHLLCIPPSQIFNKSFELGVFPCKLKVGKVIPIFKSESKFEVTNYRPISLLPIISKVFEKIMYTRIFSCIKKEHILYKQQYGFQKGKSTELAILDLQAKIISSLEKGEIPCSIFLDFAKAFDTVNHSILLQKLQYYDMRGHVLDWFTSYRNDRKQCVSLQNTNSDFITISNGVPQGSVLGPLLFLIYINDIAEVSSTLTFFLFADDTSVFFSHKNQNDLENILNTELEKLSDWLSANKLSLNVGKSNVLLFRPKNAKNELKSKLTINGEKLEEKFFAKYLGILIDNKLTFNNQTDHIKKKLIKSNCLLAKLPHFVPQKLLLNLYNAHIQPSIDYCSLVWSSAPKTYLKEISDVQNKSMRIINFCKPPQATIPLYKTSKMLPLYSNINFSSGKLVWKYSNNKLPEATKNIFSEHGVLINTRDNNKYIIPHRSTETGKKFITFNGILNWNYKIPQNIIQQKSYTSFKNMYKTHLLKTLT